MNAEEQIAVWAKHVIDGKGRSSSRNSGEDLNYRGDILIYNKDWPVSRIVSGATGFACLHRTGRHPYRSDCANIPVICTGVFSIVSGDRVSGEALHERMRWLWVRRCFDEIDRVESLPDSVLFQGIKTKTEALPIEVLISNIHASWRHYHQVVVGTSAIVPPPLIIQRMKDLCDARRRAYFSKEAVAGRERKAAAKSAKQAFGL